MPTAPFVSPLRRLLRQHRALAALVIAATLMLRVLVPAGFMPVMDASGVSLAICPGVAATATTTHHGMAAMHGGADRSHHDEGPASPRGCAFADLAVPLIGGADAVLLAAAIAFVMVLGVARRDRLPVAATPRLRPPSQGPPSFA